MSTPFYVYGATAVTGSKLVAALYLPSGSLTSASTTIAGGTVSGTATVPTSSAKIVLGLSEGTFATPFGDYTFSAEGTIAGTALPDAATVPYTVEVRLVASGTTMTSYTQVENAYDAAGAQVVDLRSVRDTTFGGLLTSGVWNFGTSSGGTGLTAQQTRDAMKLAPTAGAAAAGSIDALIASIGNVAGPGSDSCTMHFEDSVGNPIADADVWITSTAAIDTVVAGVVQTDSGGDYTFLLTAGTTYYKWLQKDGYESIQGTSFTAVAD